MKDLKCKFCGRTTPHYLSKKGQYKCIVCGTCNKQGSTKEVEFTPDFEVEEPSEVDELSEPKEEESTEE